MGCLAGMSCRVASTRSAIARYGASSGSSACWTEAGELAAVAGAGTGRCLPVIARMTRKHADQPNSDSNNGENPCQQVAPGFRRRGKNVRSVAVNEIVQDILARPSLGKHLPYYGAHLERDLYLGLVDGFQRGRPDT